MGKDLNLGFQHDESVRLDLQPVTATEAAAFEADCQSRMPPGWRIECLFERKGQHHQLTGYRIHADGEIVGFSARGTGTPPEGWTIERHNRSFYDEISVTAPNGVTVMIDDCLLA